MHALCVLWLVVDYDPTEVLMRLRDHVVAHGQQAGAALEGRLMRVEVRHGRRPEVVLALRRETIEIGRTKAAVALLPVITMRRRAVIELPPESDRMHGVYRFTGQQAVVESGFRTEWKTLR